MVVGEPPLLADDKLEPFGDEAADRNDVAEGDGGGGKNFEEMARMFRVKEKMVWGGGGGRLRMGFGGNAGGNGLGGT